MPQAPPSGISELVLEVSDLEAARRFYRDLLGFEETLYGEGRDDRFWYLIGSSARLACGPRRWGLRGDAAGSTCTSPSSSLARSSTPCSSG